MRFEPMLQDWTGCDSLYVCGQPEYEILELVLTFGQIVVEDAGCETRLSEVEAILVGFL